MISQILPLLNQYLPIHYAIKGLQSLSPEMSSFISNAGAAGYTTDQILQYMRDRFDPAAIKKEKQRLASSSNLRPDEEASYEKMKQADLPGDILQHAISGGVGLAAGLKGKQAAMAQQAPQAAQEKPSFTARDDFNRSAESYNKELQQQRQARMQASAASQASAMSNPLPIYAPKAHAFISNAVSSGNEPIAVIQHAASLFKQDMTKALKQSKMNLADLASFYQPQQPQSQAALQQQPQGMQNSSEKDDFINAVKDLSSLFG